MKLILENHILTDDEKREICSWQYTGDYALYNLPPYEQMKSQMSGFMNPQYINNYRAFYDQNVFIGFTNIKEEEKEIFIGIGVHPNLCNQGYGQKILHDVSIITQQLYPDKPLYLEVRTWNQRAIQCYVKAGFVIDGSSYELRTGIGLGTFYRMIRR